MKVIVAVHERQELAKTLPIETVPIICYKYVWLHLLNMFKETTEHTYLKQITAHSVINREGDIFILTITAVSFTVHLLISYKLVTIYLITWYHAILNCLECKMYNFMVILQEFCSRGQSHSVRFIDYKRNPFLEK